MSRAVTLQGSKPREQLLRGFSAVELLLVLSIIMVVISLLLPAILHAREAARRTHCQNNLKQLGLALHNYAELYKVLPPGVVNDEGPIFNEPEGYHFSWIVQILPEMDGGQLSGQLDFSASAYSSHNLQLARYSVPGIICPANRVQPRDKVQHSSYAACHHDRETPIDMDNVGVFTLNSGTRMEMITDGTSHTIFLGEVRLPGQESAVGLTGRGPAGLLGWMSGTRATLRNAASLNGEAILDAEAADNTFVGGFGSYHDGGAYFNFGDGSVRFVHDSIDRELYRKLANPADGELLSTWE